MSLQQFCRRTQYWKVTRLLLLLTVRACNQRAVCYAATEELGVPPSLRETIADMRFGQGDVATADRTISVHILAEVRAGDRLTNLRFYQRNVGCVNHPVPVDIADQNIHAHRSRRQDLGEFIGHTS